MQGQGLGLASTCTPTSHCLPAHLARILVLRPVVPLARGTAVGHLPARTAPVHGMSFAAHDTRIGRLIDHEWLGCSASYGLAFGQGEAF